MRQITITDFTGTTPADIWVCSEISGATCTSGNTGCEYIGEVSSFPHTFFVTGDTAEENFFIKIIDETNCLVCKDVYVIPTPTPTQTPSVTPTPTVTPNLSATPTITPSETPSVYYAYVIPEPQDATSLAELGEYMFLNDAMYFFGFGNSGIPNVNGYEGDLQRYISYSGFTGGGSKFKTDVSTLKSPIRLSSGVGYDEHGCMQQQYTFGSIEIDTTKVDPSIQYFYSIWVPDDAIPSWNNMAVNIGMGSPCSESVISDAIPSETLASLRVNVGSYGKIPPGVYRVLWLPLSATIPISLPLNRNIYFKGEYIL